MKGKCFQYCWLPVCMLLHGKEDKGLTTANMPPLSSYNSVRVNTEERLK